MDLIENIESLIESSKYKDAENLINQNFLPSFKNIYPFSLLSVIYYSTEQSFNLKKNFDIISKIISINISSLNDLTLFLFHSQQYNLCIKFCLLLLNKKIINFDTFFYLGSSYGLISKPNSALLYLHKASELSPTSADVFYNIGLVYEQLELYEKSLFYYEKAILLDESFSQAWCNKGLLLHELKRYDEAIVSMQTSLSFEPNNPDYLSNLGVTFLKKEDFSIAISYFDRALDINKSHFSSLINKGITLTKINKFNDAILLFKSCNIIYPDSIEPWLNLGEIYTNIRKFSLARDAYFKALSLNPFNEDALFGIANLFFVVGNLPASKAYYEKLISTNSKNCKAFANYGFVLKSLNLLDKAVLNFEIALNINPNLDFLFGDYFHTKMKMCDWLNFYSNCDNLKFEINNNHPVITSFPLLSLIDDPELQLKCAEIYATKRFSNIEVLPFPSDIYSNKTSRKIRIAYLSPDFREHPVSHLIVEVLESHNRDQFEVFGFYFGPKSSDAMHQRVVSAFDQYFDVTELSDQEISQLVRSYGIDIAIDLAGYTQHCRTEIFAHRCAPIQINYLGYPGTMGAKFMDYIIADKVVIPEEQQQFYSEKIIYLPGSYQPNDSKRYSSDVYKNKGDFALPRNKFVFCCFNNNFKITPDVFDCWIEILSNVDNSVLWILSDNHFAKFNLLNYLSKKYFDLSRVFFGDRIAYADHLERYRVADLFLDTFPYNAHTTASEALWSCLPVLTHCGHSFSSRVCSSLLSSLNLNELIAFSKEEYIQKAINLANDPDMLFEIKSKLKHAIYSSNFSGELFALNFEKILKNIYFSH